METVHSRRNSKRPQVNTIHLDLHEDKPMGDGQRQTLFTAGEHALLTADFKAAGIDPNRFGFYDQLAFLARESASPAYLTRYAEWVITRPIAPDYAAHVRAVVPKLAHLLATAFAAYDARGRCIAASCMMTRMLDRLQVWSFGIFGSVVLEVPALDLRRTIHTIAFKGASRKVAGHAWVCAPPFLVVDFSLALQHWDPPIARLIPDVVLAESQASAVHASVEDCVSDGVRALFAQTEGWPDPFLHHRLDPRLAGFHQRFPARDVMVPDLQMRFVPVVVQQPAERLEQMELNGVEQAGRTIWNNYVGPAFDIPALS